MGPLWFPHGRPPRPRRPDELISHRWIYLWVSCGPSCVGLTRGEDELRIRQPYRQCPWRVWSPKFYITLLCKAVRDRGVPEPELLHGARGSIGHCYLARVCSIGATASPRSLAWSGIVCRGSIVGSVLFEERKGVKRASTAVSASRPDELGTLDHATRGLCRRDMPPLRG